MIDLKQALLEAIAKLENLPPLEGQQVWVFVAFDLDQQNTYQIVFPGTLDRRDVTREAVTFLSTMFEMDDAQKAALPADPLEAWDALDRHAEGFVYSLQCVAIQPLRPISIFD